MRNILLTIFMFLICACGGETVKVVQIEKETPGQQPPPITTPPGGGALTFTAIKPILDDNCAQASCHAGAGYLETEDAFLSSNSPNRIRNGSMPPGYSPDLDKWTPEIKKQVLDYIDASQ